MIARDQFAQQSGSSFAEEKSRYEAYFMWLRNLSTELVCQLEGFAVAVAVMVIWGILGFVIEWYWNMAIGAMYAGAFLGRPRRPSELSSEALARSVEKLARMNRKLARELPIT